VSRKVSDLSATATKKRGLLAGLVFKKHFAVSHLPSHGVVSLHSV